MDASTGKLSKEDRVDTGPNTHLGIAALNIYRMGRDNDPVGFREGRYNRLLEIALQQARYTHNLARVRDGVADARLAGSPALDPKKTQIWIPFGPVGRPDKPALPDGSPREDKIAAIGVRIRHWVSFHGISINVEPDLSHYAGIVPCGIAGHGVTSLVDLGLPVTLADLDMALAETFVEVFGSLPDKGVRPSAAA